MWLIILGILMMPIRDSNNVQGALSQAASLGRGGDNKMVHATSGEVMIPPEVIDNHPQVMTALIKAFSESGMDWRRYLVGSGENSKNPSTGAQEFFGYDAGPADRGPGSSAPSGGRDGGGRIGYDLSTNSRGLPQEERDAFRDVFGTDSIPAGTNYGGASKKSISPWWKLGGGALGLLTGGVPGALLGADAGGTLGNLAQNAAPPPGGYGSPPAVPEGTGGDGRPRTPSAPTVYGPQAPMAAPGYLGFHPDMTDLQRRAQIATFGLNADDSRFTSEETTNYYKNLLQQGISRGETPLPIERQYLQQVLGIEIPGESNEFMRLLGGEQTVNQEAFNNSGDPYRSGSSASGF